MGATAAAVHGWAGLSAGTSPSSLHPRRTYRGMIRSCRTSRATARAARSMRLAFHSAQAESALFGRRRHPFRDGWKDSRRFVADPFSSGFPYRCGKLLARRSRQDISKHRAMKDDERRVSRGRCCQWRQVCQQIAPDHIRRIAPRDVDGGAQSRYPLILSGPDQRLKPCRVLLRFHVDWIEVQSSAPHDARDRFRHRGRAGDFTSEHRRAAFARYGRINSRVAVVVSIVIQQQAQPGRGPDLQQRERLRKLRQ